MISGHFLDEEVERLRNIFHISGYPEKVIAGIFRESRRRIFGTEKVYCAKPKEPYFGIPYNGPQSQTFVNRILTAVQMSFWIIKDSPLFRRRTLLHYFSKSYKNYNVLNSPCVYSIRCADCSKCYIGETGRAVGIRCKEHERLGENSALSFHSRNTGHMFQFSDSRILISEGNIHKMKVMESLSLKKANHVFGKSCIRPAVILICWLSVDHFFTS